MELVERLRSEFAYLSGAVRILRRVTPIAKDKSRIFPNVLDNLAARHGDRVALLNDTETLTYNGLLARSNQYARWALDQGVGKGDTVALMMMNRPEYLAIWMGIIRVGGVVALINTNLTGQPLAHCLNIVRARHLIVGPELAAAVEGAHALLDPPPRIWVAGQSSAGHERIEHAIDKLPDDAIPAADRPAITTEDPALYIYTSGTTGLPKAAVINHYRVQGGMAAYSAVCRSGPDDRIYNTLPLYHTTGGILAPGVALWTGGSCFIRERFSARQFWDDVVAHDCTMFQYIGELCRYLLNAPTSPGETRHKIRLCNGNGLRPDIWMDFKTRFRIPEIVEWYAATEGNVILFNMDGKPGAVGRIPKWLERRFQTKIVRFDVKTETPVRGPDGFCIECGPGEIGEAIGRISNDPSAPGQRFDGYADKSETARKVLENAFEQGDRWFRTGDLLKKDERGYFFFIDRVGDTFRWKGENVATSEVAEAITVFPGVRDANVYGVEVAGHEGNAGMAALVVEDHFDLAGLRAHIDGQLPAYARPIFLRIKREIEVTGTFKQKKVELRKEGFDPQHISDNLYFSDPETGSFRKLDAALHERIQAGEFRL